MKNFMNKCAVCGSKNLKRLTNQSETVEFKVGNKIKKFTLAGLSFSKCPDCGECYLNAEDAAVESRKLREALAQDRVKRGLLTADEIKEIRESFGFSQAQFEKMLGFGAKSFARWETYRADQSKAADMLLRALKEGGEKLLKSLIASRHRKAA